MRLGAVFPHGQFRTVDPDAVVRLVQRLEDAGYDHLLVYDHVLGADITNRPDWTGYYNSTDPFLEPLVLLAYLARACALELVTDVLVLPQRQTRSWPSRWPHSRARARPHPPRCRDRVERCRVPGARRGLPYPCGPDGGGDSAAASALDRTERDPHGRVGGDRRRGHCAVAACAGSDLDRMWHRPSRRSRASGASPTGGCRSRRSNRAGASNPHGPKCARPPPPRVVIPMRWGSRASSGHP